MDLDKMSRYKTTNLIIDKRKKVTRYGTTIYDDVPENNDDIYVITQEGDRFDNLAFEYYGNPNMWWFLARVNNMNTMNISNGIRLRIPVTTINAKGK